MVEVLYRTWWCAVCPGLVTGERKERAASLPREACLVNCVPASIMVPRPERNGSKQVSDPADLGTRWEAAPYNGKAGGQEEATQSSASEAEIQSGGLKSLHLFSVWAADAVLLELTD